MSQFNALSESCAAFLRLGGVERLSRQTFTDKISLKTNPGYQKRTLVGDL
jgi:hypothetical protein